MKAYGPLAEETASTIDGKFIECIMVVLSVGQVISIYPWEVLAT